MPVNELHDPRKVPWVLWLVAPFACWGIICLILAVVTMIVGPFEFLAFLFGAAR